jgi:hypothetical protein
MNTYNIHINLPPEAVSLATAPVAVSTSDNELVADLKIARSTIEAIAACMGVEDPEDTVQLVQTAKRLLSLDTILNEVAMAVGYHGDDNSPIPGLVLDRITEARHLEEQVAQLTGDLKEAEGTIAELRSIRAQLTGELAQAEKRAAAAGTPAVQSYKAGDLVIVTWPDGATTAPGIVRGHDPETGRYKVDYFDLPPSGGSGETWAEASRLAVRSGDEPGDPPAEETKPKATRAPRKKKADEPAPEGGITWPEGVTREDYTAWENEQHAMGVTEGVNPLEYKRLRDAGLIIAKPPAEEPKAPAPDVPTAELLHPGTRVTYEANPSAGIYQSGTGSIVSPSKVHGGPGYVVERDQGGRCVMAAASVKEVVAEEVLEEEPAPPAPTEQTSQLAKAFDQLPKAALTVGAKVLALLSRGAAVFATVETVWDNGLRVQLKTAEGREFVEGERIRARHVVYLTPGGERLAATIIGIDHLETGRVDLVFEASGKDALGVPVMDLWPAPDAPVEPDSQFTDDPAEANPFAGSDF